MVHGNYRVVNDLVAHCNIWLPSKVSMADFDPSSGTVHSVMPSVYCHRQDWDQFFATFDSNNPVGNRSF